MRKDRKESNATEFENSTAEASPASRGGATNAKTKTANANTAQISSSRQISFGQFTESDKRSVIQKFLSSQEVLFLIYGLMFPSQTIAAANQALNGPTYQTSQL